MRSDDRRAWRIPPRRWPWVIALLTFLFHALVALGLELPGRFLKYPAAAEQYLQGELPAVRLVDFSPLYFYLNVAAERWIGSSDELLQGLQIALVAAAAGMLFALFRRRFPVGLAVAAVVVLALDRRVLIYERILEPEACLLFFLVAFLYFVERPGRGSAWIAGGFAALSLATRPTFLPVFFLTPWLYWLRGARGRRLVRDALGITVPVVAMMLVLMLRSAAITGDPRTPVMNPGTVFYEGNNPLSRGTSARYPPLVLALAGHASEVPDSPHQHYRTVARAAAGEELSVAEVNSYWAGKAWRFIAAEPGRFLRLLGDKLVQAFHSYRWHDVGLGWRYDLVLPVPAVPLALVSALALVGTLIEARRWPTSILYYALGGFQLVVMVVFYVSARQRMVMLPALLWFAAATAEAIRRRGWRRSLPLQGLIVLVALVLIIPNDLMRDESYRRRGFQVVDPLVAEIRSKVRDEPLARYAPDIIAGMTHAPFWIDWMRPVYFPQEERSLDEAVAAALASRREAGTLPGPWVPVDFDHAVTALRAGRIAVAEALLTPLAEGRREVYRGARQPSEPLFYLGRAAALRGDRERAVELLGEALERSPGNPFVLAELVALTDDPGYQEALLAFASSLDGQYLLGQALLVHGRPREAAAAFGFVVRRLPGFREGRIHLAVALGACGRVDEGAGHYLEAVRERLEPNLLSPAVAELFRRWAALQPNDSVVRFYAARVLHQQGHFQEALDLLAGLDPPTPLRTQVTAERTRIRRAIAATGR